MTTPTRSGLQQPPLRAVAYVRISRDREGAGLGVERQEADCRALAERLGWEIAEVYQDNDISAYSGKPRPAYRAMLDAIRRGSVKGVVAWHTDRLHRRAVELEEFIAAVDEHQVQVQTVTSGTVDLSTASGRMVARMLGAAAQHEVDHARERMKRAKSQMAVDGKYRGGPRPYGFESNGVTVREDEAQVIREMTRSVIAGRSLRSLASELNERGLTTSTGKSWTYARLRDILVRPRNAGLLGRGRADRNEVEVIGQAEWTPIISEEEWRAAYGILNDSSRRIQDGNATRWLGSGIYRCGKCGTTMRPAPYGGTPKRDQERRYLYRCTAQAHLTISSGPTDEYVRQIVAELIRDPRVIAAMGNDDGALNEDRSRREALTRRMEAFENDYTNGVIDGAIYQRATAKVAAELTEVEARLSDSLQRSVSTEVVGAPDPGAAFLAAPIDVQRAVLASVLQVEVLPVPYRGAAWTTDRLRITQPS